MTRIAPSAVIPVTSSPKTEAATTMVERIWAPLATVNNLETSTRFMVLRYRVSPSAIPIKVDAAISPMRSSGMCASSVTLPIMEMTAIRKMVASQQRIVCSGSAAILEIRDLEMTALDAIARAEVRALISPIITFTYLQDEVKVLCLKALCPFGLSYLFSFYIV